MRDTEDAADNAICRQQKQLLKNIEELNVLNKKMGLPLIKVEVKTTLSSREPGVAQNIAVPPNPRSPSPSPSS